MQVNVKLDFLDDDEKKLRKALGDHVDLNYLHRIAEICARAGARECLAQATGTAVFSAMTDLSRFRVFCLLQEGMSISEAEVLVASIFKVPSSSAKRLVNAAVARYKVELDALASIFHEGLILCEVRAGLAGSAAVGMLDGNHCPDRLAGLCGIG